MQLTETNTDIPLPTPPVAPPPGPATTKVQRDLMAHALGLSRSHGQLVTRNHFCAHVGGPTAAELEPLIRLGLMYRGRTINEGRDFYAHVTEAGAAELGVELRRED